MRSVLRGFFRPSSASPVARSRSRVGPRRATTPIRPFPSVSVQHDPVSTPKSVRSAFLRCEPHPVTKNEVSAFVFAINGTSQLLEVTMSLPCVHVVFPDGDIDVSARGDQRGTHIQVSLLLELIAHIAGLPLASSIAKQHRTSSFLQAPQ